MGFGESFVGSGGFRDCLGMRFVKRVDGGIGFVFIWNAQPCHWRGRVLESACQRL